MALCDSLGHDRASFLPALVWFCLKVKKEGKRSNELWTTRSAPQCGPWHRLWNHCAYIPEAAVGCSGELRWSQDTMNECCCQSICIPNLQHHCLFTLFLPSRFSHSHLGTAEAKLCPSPSLCSQSVREPLWVCNPPLSHRPCQAGQSPRHCLLLFQLSLNKGT